MALPNIITPIGRIDMTLLDYNGIVQQIRNLITSNQDFQPQFTSLFESDAGVMLIELFAQIAHLNNLRIDFIANELSWLNAEQPETILNYLPLIDYRLHSVTASTTNVIGSVVGQAGNISPVQILIPGRTQITARNTAGNTTTAEFLAGPTNYTGDILLAANQRSYSLNVTAGITDFAIVTVNQQENFTFLINQTNVIDTSIQIFQVLDNNQFEMLPYVDSFITPLASLPQWTVRFDFQGRPTIIFGNRFFGGAFQTINPLNPQTWITLRVYYRYLTDDTGTLTNFTPGSIQQTLTFRSADTGSNIQIAFFNQTIGVGGSNILTLEQVRQIAPLTIRTANKNVTNEDYEIALSENSLVKNVLAVTPIEEPNASIPIFHAWLYVAPNRTNVDFISAVSPIPPNKLPDVLPGQTQDQYEITLLQALSNFYNITGMETQATITSTNAATTYPIVLQVSDRMRLLVNTIDVQSGYIDVHFKENLSKPIGDIIDEINIAVGFPFASNVSGFIQLQSPVVGTGSFVQLLGNLSDPIDETILQETYTVLGFTENQFDQGLAQTAEAAFLGGIIDDGTKRIIGIENRFRAINPTPFTISALVYTGPNVNPDTVQQQVINALYDKYSYQAGFMGQSIATSDIGSVITSVTGVKFPVLQGWSDLSANTNQIFYLIDQVILNNLPTEFPALRTKYLPNIVVVRQSQ